MSLREILHKKHTIAGLRKKYLGHRNSQPAGHLSPVEIRPTATDDPSAESQAFRERFYALLDQRPPGTLLEIGARNRTSPDRKPYIPTGWKYEGLDIAPDVWVTIIGDAHNLRAKVRRNSIDAVVSAATFEHLLMPWKVVLEMNYVLRRHGLVYVTSHQTFPLHELPADYWRFSADAWHALFNKYTGFRVIETGMTRPATIIPNAVVGVSELPAYILSLVIAEKTHDTRLKWKADAQQILPLQYPL